MMPEPRPGYLLDLIRTATDLDFGLLIETDNVEACRTDLYNKLKLDGISTEDLDIQVCIPSTPNTIYILKRSVELPE
jgi:hypothetical protein